MQSTRIRIAAALLQPGLRHALRHPGQCLLALIGIALGVAVVVAVDLARDSAQHSFDRAIDDVTGRSTHRILGGPKGVDESLYAALRVQHGIHPLAPVVETQVTVSGQAAILLTWLGLDPLAEASFRDATSAFQRNERRDFPVALMTEPGTALIAPSTAARLAAQLGDIVRVDHRGRTHALRIAGWLGNAGDPDSPRFRNLIVTDIATAQELLGMHGRLTRIDVISDESAAERIRRRLPPDVELVAGARHNQALAQMTRGFTMQLQALSLLAVLVGMFLIHNTMTFLVLERREVLGILRALGVTRGEIFQTVAAEAVCLALAGTLLGILAGMALGSELTRMVARTISDHYYALTVQGLMVSPWIFIKAGLVGLAGTLVAALAPARDAARVLPGMAMRRVTVEISTARSIRTLPLAAAGLLLAALFMLAVPGSIYSGFTGLALLVIGGTALVPAACEWILRGSAASVVRFFGWRGELATGGIVRSFSRTAPAIAALMLAVATTIGIGLMVQSFRGAVEEWLEQLLRADLYISASAAGQAAQPLPEALAERIRALPGVETISTARRITLDSQHGRQQLVVYQLAPKSYAGFRFLAGGDDQAWTAFEHGKAVMVSEPYALRHDLAPEAFISLRTDRGPHRFAVAGVYRDYGSDQGTIAISRRTYERYFDDRAITGIGIYRREGVTMSALIESVHAVIAPLPQVSVRSQEAVRRSSLQIFDRTFTITEVLRVIAGIIAFIGVAGSLLAIQIEQRQQHGILRTLGVTPDELAVVIVAQAGLMGLLAGVLAIPLGIAMAAALVYVINVNAFGWSMALHVELHVLLLGLAIATLAALVAGTMAAFAVRRLRPVECLRQE